MLEYSRQHMNHNSNHLNLPILKCFLAAINLVSILFFLSDYLDDFAFQDVLIGKLNDVGAVNWRYIGTALCHDLGLANHFHWEGSCKRDLDQRYIPLRETLLQLHVVPRRYWVRESITTNPYISHAIEVWETTKRTTCNCPDFMESMSTALCETSRHVGDYVWYQAQYIVQNRNGLTGVPPHNNGILPADAAINTNLLQWWCMWLDVHGYGIFIIWGGMEWWAHTLQSVQYCRSAQLLIISFKGYHIRECGICTHILGGGIWSQPTRVVWFYWCIVPPNHWCFAVYSSQDMWLGGFNLFIIDIKFLILNNIQVNWGCFAPQELYCNFLLQHRTQKDQKDYWKCICILRENHDGFAWENPSGAKPMMRCIGELPTEIP